MSFRPNEILETDRLRLRPPTLDDATAIFDGYGQDPAVSRYTNWRPHASIETTRLFLAEAVDAWHAEGRYVWVIEDRDSAELLGGFEIRVEDHRVELGYVLRQASWGEGRGSEATRAVVEHALACPEIWRVWAYCHVDNAASTRVLENSSMQREGRLRRGFLFPNLCDDPGDVYLYAVTKYPRSQACKCGVGYEAALDRPPEPTIG